MRTLILLVLLALTANVTEVHPRGISHSPVDAPVLPTARWFHPLASGAVPSAYFQAPVSAWGPGHRGVDFHTTLGERVFAPAAGTVTFVGEVAAKPVLTIAIAPDLLVSVEPVRSTLSVGDQVRSGMVIGEVASGGHCLSECLHLGIRRGETYLNPVPFLYDKPRLLPIE